MPLASQTIREAFVTRLGGTPGGTGITTAPTGLTEIDTVLEEYVWDVPDEYIAAANVIAHEMENDVSGDAEGDGQTLGGIFKAEVEIHVELWAKQNSGGSAKLDRMTSEVLKKVYPSASDYNLGGAVNELDFLGWTSERDDAERPVRKRTMRWRAVYYWQFNAPDSTVFPGS